MKLFYATILGTQLLLSVVVNAHEGHDDKEPTPVVSPDQIVTQEMTTETVELVWKHRVFEAGKSISARVFLSTADENKPIANAILEFEFADLNGLKIKFASEKDHPGIYSAQVRLPKSGSFNASISVASEKINDLLALSDIEVKSQPEAMSSWSSLFIYLGAGAVALVILAILIVIVLRRRKHV